MRRESPPNDFIDAVGICNLTLPETAAYLGRSINSIQSYAAGRRRSPEDLVTRLIDLWYDAVLGDGDNDRHGTAIPEGALAIRRLRRHPAMTTFDTLREAMARNPQPDPDAGPGWGPEPDFEHDDGDDR